MKNSGKMIWFIFPLIGVFVWLGVKIGDLMFDQRKIEEASGELAEKAFLQGSHGIEEEISKLMRSFGVEVDSDDIKLEMSPLRDKVTLDFDYRRIVDFGFTQRSYPFHVHSEKYPKHGSGAGAYGDAVERSIERSNQDTSNRYGESFQNP